MNLLSRHIIFCFLLLLNINLCFSQIDTIQGLVLWLNGDSVHLSGGSKVDICYDMSALGNHAIQSSSPEQPIVIQTTLNNHKSILFDGIDDYLNFNQITTIRTVFWLVKESSVATQNYRPLLGHINDYDFHRGNGTDIWNAAAANIGVLNGTTKLNFNTINGATTALNPQYSIISLVTTNNVKADNFSNDRFAAGRYWEGELLELIIYDKALAPNQVDNVEQYLHDKYAPAVNIGHGATKNSFCDSLLSAGSGYLDYLWSNGATTSAINVINNNGKYWIRTTDVFGRVSSDTVNIAIRNFTTFKDSIFCEGTAVEWNTNLPKSDFNFQWQDNSTDSLFNITQAGNYYVKITDSFGCNITTDTVKITEDNFATTTTLGPDISLCSGNPITLTSGASSSNSYTWNTGSTNDSLLITNTGQYSVIVTNTNNCVAKDTINVTVIGLAPVANFSTSIGCKNRSVSFIDLSVPPSGNTILSYDWDFGDISSAAANTSTLTNPFHTFSDTGNYTIRLKIITNVGCEQFITKKLHIAPTPTVNFTSGISCQNDSTAFSSLCTSTAGYPITALNWNFGDPGLANTSSLNSPKHLFSNQANYTIKLVATNNAGCKDSLINIIAVKAQVKANFSYSSACTNTATIFQDNSIVPSPNSSNTRLWNFGNSTSNNLIVTKTYTSSGVYSVTLSVAGNNGCSSSITKLITIFSPPIASFTIPAICAKDTLTITNTSSSQSGIISSYDWKLNNNSFSSIQNPTLSVSSAGTYSVKLNVTNSFGCENSITNTLSVNPIPIVNFVTTPTTYYYINSSIVFTPNITNANLYLWTISGYSPFSIQSPTVTYAAEGSYSASLFLVDQFGCKNSVTKILPISKRYLDVAILNVMALKDNDGFMTVQADVANYGTIPASTLDMNYKISDGGNINETWNGNLNPNTILSYTFNAKTATQTNSTNNITCVDIKKINGINDENESNNSLCNVINSNEIAVSNPIPNPTNADITLPIILNKDIDFTISIYNSTGQIVYEDAPQRGNAGLNLMTLQTSNYPRGCYIIKTVIADKIFIKKFIKVSND